MATHVYDPKSMMLIFGGIPLEGYGEDTFIVIEQLSEGNTSKSGADGEIAVSKSSDKRHGVTVSLLQTSASNDVLSNAYAVFDATPGGKFLPLMAQDLAGRTLFMAGQAWVTKRPNAEYGQEASNREWVIHTGAPSVYNLGGNF